MCSKRCPHSRALKTRISGPKQEAGCECISISLKVHLVKFTNFYGDDDEDDDRLSSDRRSWILRLEPRTAFLWSTPGNYGALGLTSPDAERAALTNRILSTQALANGLER